MIFVCGVSARNPPAGNLPQAEIGEKLGWISMESHGLGWVWMLYVRGIGWDGLDLHFQLHTAEDFGYSEI